MTTATALPTGTRYHSKLKRDYSIRLVDIMIAIIAIELIAGGIIVARELIEARKIRAQITQISSFNSAVATFYKKYDGIPGDLLAAQAERMGLPTGNGTPAHSDGDGKISPCSPGWQGALGCESGLFWAQLASIEMIPGSFRANVRFSDNRVEATDLLSYYLPQAEAAPDVYFTVWNSDRNQLAHRDNVIPDGNYYELTALHSIENSKIVDEPYAISPLMARAIDRKMDDGYPLRGRIIVNGDADSPGESWSNYAQTSDLECVTEGEVYNTRDYFKAHRRLCHLAIAIENPNAESD